MIDVVKCFGFVLWEGKTCRLFVFNIFPSDRQS